jgi:hypothetical protein
MFCVIHAFDIDPVLPCVLMLAGCVRVVAVVDRGHQAGLALGDQLHGHGAEILGDDQVDGVRRAGAQQVAEILDHHVRAGQFLQADADRSPMPPSFLWP